jgi:hypothetical protein
MSVLDLIGHTPLMEINKINPNKKVRISAKLEGTNPGGSVKDRPAYYMVKEAEKTGDLVKDKIILEITQIGKCIMPKEGVFAKVIRGGLVKAGDQIERINEDGNEVEKFPILRFTQEGKSSVEYEVAKELPVTIILNDQELVTLLCSPANIRRYRKRNSTHIVSPCNHYYVCIAILY